jgi:hypothetical protein
MVDGLWFMINGLEFMIRIFGFGFRGKGIRFRIQGFKFGLRANGLGFAFRCAPSASSSAAKKLTCSEGGRSNCRVYDLGLRVLG